MKQLSITQAKPNPSGKDKFGSLIPSSQLAGEWVDFKNTGDESYPLTNIKLYHIAYTVSYPNGIWEEVIDFNGFLGVNKTIRVHSGGVIPLNILYSEDLVDADYHLFTGKKYVWNNHKSDTPRLALKENGQFYEIDKATYSVNPPEGKILKRYQNYLI